MFRSILTYFRKRAIYRKTYAELSSLSAHELYDLGIDASSIRSLAYESAYGKEYK